MVGKVLKCGEEGTPIAGLLKAKNAPISTFEQGVVDMQHYLEQFGEGGKWSQAEIKEFLEGFSLLSIFSLIDFINKYFS